MAANFDLPVKQGLGIVSVGNGSPADRAGLQVEDVIVTVAGKAVTNMAELDGMLINYRIGTTVEIDFFREDNMKTVQVTLGERPTS